MPNSRPHPNAHQNAPPLLARVRTAALAAVLAILAAGPLAGTASLLTGELWLLNVAGGLSRAALQLSVPLGFVAAFSARAAGR